MLRAAPFALSTLALVALGACAASDEAQPPTLALPPAVYVAVDGDDNAAGRDPDEPVATIAVGMQRALGCAPAPCPVKIAEGEYVEDVALVASVDLEGGYATGFLTRDPEAHPTVVRGEATSLVAEDLTAPTVVSGLTVRGPDRSMLDDGSSSYAVWVTNSGAHLVLRDVVIEAGRGAAGADGAMGEVATCSAAGGPGGEAFDCGGSVGGPGGADGDPVSGGEGGPPGSSNCPNACPLVGSDGISDGGRGTDGNLGADGAAGLAADDVQGTFDPTGWTGALGMAGERGQHGTGGGGGGSGGSKKFAACFGCGTLVGGRGGDGAPGGCGGGGGEPGAPGGGAFGIVVDASNVQAEGVAILGGIGGPGGGGGDGALGAMGSVENTNGLGGAPGQQCGAINYQAGAGAVGGYGGDGGRGGGGAGGVGGASIALVVLRNGTLIDGGFEVVAGEGGPGGTGGDGDERAPDGRVGAAETFASF